MAGNTFGTAFRLTSFGESHGPAIGGVIDGCPSGLTLDIDRVQQDLSYRRPGQSAITTSRNESDQIEFLSGIFEGVTTGAPIAFITRNHDIRPSDYSVIENVYRPSHADYTWEAKYGLRDHRGSGRASARETLARVVAGSVAAQFLEINGISTLAYTKSIGTINAEITEPLKREDIYNSIARCPDTIATEEIEQVLTVLRSKGDTTGGIIECTIKNLPAGLGEPVFDKLNADLAKAMMSINAAKGFEIGSGFKASSMKGSEHNDPFVNKGGTITTSTNNSGGIQGGLSNGQPVVFRVAFKPISTIMIEQDTVNSSGEPEKLVVKGRHDPCVVPRAVIIVESMANLVVADHMLRQRMSKI